MENSKTTITILKVLLLFAFASIAWLGLSIHEQNKRIYALEKMQKEMVKEQIIIHSNIITISSELNRRMFQE